MRTENLISTADYCTTADATEVDDASDAAFDEPLTGDYAWRFELLRSTVEDFSQLIADETSAS